MGLDAHHSRLVSASEAMVVESAIQKEPAVWKFGDRETEILPGSWVMAVKVFDDALWNEIMDGSIATFSPSGWGTLTPTKD